MQPTVTMCRAQEARQHALALSTPLANARQIAMLAAAAWGKEAVLAEKREERMQRRKAFAGVEAGLVLELPLADESGFGGGPDRNYPDVGAIRT